MRRRCFSLSSLAFKVGSRRDSSSRNSGARADESLRNAGRECEPLEWETRTSFVTHGGSGVLEISVGSVVFVIECF